MEPVSMIVSALVLGIAAAVKPTAEQAIKDAYEGLKTLIRDRYKISLENLEKKPTSKSQQDAIEEYLEDAKASEDKEVLNKAKAIIDIVEQYDAQVALTVGVIIEDVKAAYFKANDIITAEGSTGLHIKNAEFNEGIETGTIRTGGRNDPN